MSARQHPRLWTLRSAASAIPILLLLLLAAPARAEDLYLLPGDAAVESGPGWTAVELPDGVLLVTPDGAAPPPFAEARRLELPPGWTGFLYRMEARRFAEAGRELLLRKARILHDSGEGWMVVAAPGDGLRELDGVRADKERLAYIPSQPTVVPGRISVATAREEVKEELLQRLDLEGYSIHLQDLAGARAYLIDGEELVNGDRYTFSERIGRSYDYIEDRFENLGYSVIRQTFPVGTNGTAQNIVAVKTGSVFPDSIIVLGAHLDAIAKNRPDWHPAPGAEDNASGTAAVLHLAEVFSHYRVEKTVHFVAFGGEEQGLYGSTHYVSEARDRGEIIVAALVMDMISAYIDHFAVLVEGEPIAEWLMELMIANTEEFAQIPATKLMGASGSDHVPFLRANIPALLAIDEDWDRYPYYHLGSDNYNKVEPSLGIAIAKGIAATLVDLTNPVPISEPTLTTLDSRGFRLHNEPNPFNPATTIRFELSRDAGVVLEILDVAGRRVRLLHSGALDAGPQAIRWDGRDRVGRAVGSGIYYYRVLIDGVPSSGRMVLVR